jgi:hypothetical protein
MAAKTGDRCKTEGVTPGVFDRPAANNRSSDCSLRDPQYLEFSM